MIFNKVTTTIQIADLFRNLVTAEVTFLTLSRASSGTATSHHLQRKFSLATLVVEVWRDHLQEGFGFAITDPPLVGIGVVLTLLTMALSND